MAYRRLTWKFRKSSKRLAERVMPWVAGSRILLGTITTLLTLVFSRTDCLAPWGI